MHVQIIQFNYIEEMKHFHYSQRCNYNNETYIPEYVHKWH